MSIASIDFYRVAVPPRRVHNWATKMSTPIGAHLLVKVLSDRGRCGWGEAPALASWGGPRGRHYGETPATVQAVIEACLFPVARGRRPQELGAMLLEWDRVLKGHPYAKAALEMAILDLWGHEVSLPVHDLLGGAVRQEIPVCHSLGIMDSELALAEAERAVAEGIETIKVKAGLDPQRDVALVAALRERLGAQVHIRVDANEGYPDAKSALAVITRMQAHGLLLFEQPVMDPRAMAEVTRRTPVPIMADETAWDMEDLVRIRTRGESDLISLYVTKPGGLMRARDLAAVACAWGIGHDVGGSIELGIGNAANLQLAAVAPGLTLASVVAVTSPAGTGPEVAGRYYLDDVVTEPFAYRAGRVRVPDGPGLGIRVDEEKVARYAR